MKTKWILPTELKVGDTIIRKDGQFKVKAIRPNDKFPKLLDVEMETGMQFSLVREEEYEVVAG